MALNNLHTLLERFKHFSPPNASVRRATAEAVREVAGVVISFEGVSVKNETAYIDVPPAAKSEIALHKAAILRHIAEALGSHTLVRDIR